MTVLAVLIFSPQSQSPAIGKECVETGSFIPLLLSSYFPAAVTRFLDKINFKEKGLFWLTVLTCRPSWEEDDGGRNLMQLDTRTVRRGGSTSAVLSHFLLLTASTTHVQGVVLPIEPNQDEPL